VGIRNVDEVVGRFGKITVNNNGDREIGK